VNRRAFLRSVGVGGAALSFGCAVPRSVRLRGAPDTSFVDTACDLPPVVVSPDREIRTVVGLRPYRPSGFVVRTERLGDTLVVHNYGHGGGGITLSWGTAKLAVDLGAPGHTGPVAVLGAGVVGLSTARLLQEAGFAVTIYAKDLPPNTTSNIAGGQWRPVSVSEREHTTAAFNEQLLNASTFAFARYQAMVGSKYGVRWMRNYFLHQEPFSPQGSLGDSGPLRHVQPELRELQPHEHPFKGYAHVRQLDTMLIEPPIYLSALLDDVRRAGGVVQVRELADRAALQALPEKLVFNCTGLGAKKLFDDQELVPVKGQLTFLLPQPEVQYAVCTDELYMFSRTDGVLLGGTFEKGVWTLEPNLDKKREILAGHQAFFERMRPC
jgi:glycine/D-amino acid oxidase-like deaminating enzyme